MSSRQHARNAEPANGLSKVNPVILQVVSGLAKHMTLEELQGRRVVIVANLKPANMRKVLSQAMVLAATAPDGGKVGPGAEHARLPAAAQCACLLSGSYAKQNMVWNARRYAGWELTGSHAWDAPAHRVTDYPGMPDKHVAFINQHCKHQDLSSLHRLESTHHISLQLMGIGSCEGGAGGAASRFCSW